MRRGSPGDGGGRPVWPPESGSPRKPERTKGSISPVWILVAIGALFLLWFFPHIRSAEKKGRDVLRRHHPGRVISAPRPRAYKGRKEA